MFVVTNRNLRPELTGLDQFGPLTNVAGPNELRMVEVTRARGVQLSLWAQLRDD